MGRLDRRIRRLAQQLKDSEPARRQARLARMSDEELTARIVKAALALGMPEELAHGGLEAIMSWDREYRLKVRETLTEWDESALLKRLDLNRSPQMSGFP